MVWRNGRLPPDSPQYDPDLSASLLEYGYSLLRMALRLRDLEGDRDLARRAFERSAESIEAVVRNGSAKRRERGFLTVCAAAAYHLAGFSARAYSLISRRLHDSNTSPAEQAVALLIVRALDQLSETVIERIRDEDLSDVGIAHAMNMDDPKIDTEDVLQIALNTHFLRALATFQWALATGQSSLFEQSTSMVSRVEAVSSNRHFVTLWWIAYISRHLLDDLWDHSLHVRLPTTMGGQNEAHYQHLREIFIASLFRRSISEVELWPSQLGAASRALDLSDDLVVALPTSAGKTRIAELCALTTLSTGRRVLIVTPLRALSAQTERTFRRTFGPLGFTVSSLYGAAGASSSDADTLGNRDIVVSTPEKLDFALRNDSHLIDDVGLIVLDEGHMIGPTEREIRYEILVQRLLRREDAHSRRIVCLSAILPDGEQLEDFVAWLRSDEVGQPVQSRWRPTRQRYGLVRWNGQHARLDILLRREGTFIPKLLSALEPEEGRQRKNPYPQNQQELVVATAWRFVDEGQDVLVFCAERRSVEPYAKKAVQLFKQGLVKPLIDENTVNKLSRVERVGREWLGDNHPAVACLRLGIAVHHGGLPNPYLREVEAALREGLLKVTIASPTLAQGLNLSAAVLLVPSIYRYGEPISPEEFANVAGRAGRAYVDIDGVILNVLFQPTQLKVREWVQLIRSAAERSVESGIFKLVLLIAERLAAQGALSSANAYEYLVNTPEAWIDQNVEVTDLDGDEEEVEQEGEPLEAMVSRLDAALLSLVEPLDCPVEDLPGRLEEALASSLWARRLSRLDSAGRDMQLLILQARSELIWRQTTPIGRRGYFNAGMGFRTGQFLDEHAADLEAHLEAADDAALGGQPEQMAEALVPFAETVFSSAPFTPRLEPPVDWPAIIASWIAGDPANQLIRRFGDRTIDFIEDALCYRLVWAMEAVRVRAAVHRSYDPLVAGAAAMCVETGMPNTRAALLVRSGLPSRTAALRATEDVYADFIDHADMTIWLRSEGVLERSTAENWPTVETHSLWIDFLERLHKGREAAWEESMYHVPVHWFEGVQPSTEAAHTFRIISDLRQEQYVCTADLVPIGVLGEQIPELADGRVMVSGIADSGELLVRRLGPAI